MKDNAWQTVFMTTVSPQTTAEILLLLRNNSVQRLALRCAGERYFVLRSSCVSLEVRLNGYAITSLYSNKLTKLGPHCQRLIVGIYHTSVIKRNQAQKT